MHDEIIRYSMAGELPDSNIVQAKERLVTFLEGQMKDSGCVPVLDLEPQFSWWYDFERDVYRFELSVYGNFVGRQAWSIAGTMNGTTITSTIQKAR